MPLSPATRPTFYFIGVTTGKSSIVTVFPEWAAYLGLGDVAMVGIDLVPDAPPEAYRAVVAFLKDDPLSLGALVTTHKLDLFAACEDLFDTVDPHAALMAETSCLSKRDGKLICHAKDPVSSGLALDGFLPATHFARTGAEVLSIGAGGSSIALTWHLIRPSRGADRPARIVVTDPDQGRLDHIRAIHDRVGSGVPRDYVRVEAGDANDRILSTLPAGSLVVNATGMGKDTPGSPLTPAARFPERGIVWELNYRGSLVFLEQARAQEAARALRIEDGWTYFIHGWTQVIGEVFDVEIPTTGPRFDALSRIAAETTGRA